MDEYVNRVAKLAWVMYEIDEDIIEGFMNEIEECYEQNYTPRRTVEVIADFLFG